MSATIDPAAVPYCQTPAGVACAEDFAEQTITHALSMAEIANLDLVIVSLFALSELLANLQFHAGVSAEDAIKHVASFTEQRVSFLEAEHEDPSARDDGTCAAVIPVVH